MWHPSGVDFGTTFIVHIYFLDPLNSIFQFYSPVGLAKKSSIARVCECYNDFRLWLTNNLLQLNESKTEVLIVALPHHLYLPWPVG